MRIKRVIKAWPYDLCYLMSRGRSFRPLNLTLEITHRCNLRCRMCLFYGMEKEKNNRNYSQELSLSLWERLIEEVRPWQTAINITGGEPFLRNDLMEMVEIIKNRGLVCSINTNGVLGSPEKLEKLLKLGLDHFTFSIDGPEAIHDRIRGEKGAFEKMLKNIRWVAENRSASPTLWGICVISKENVERLEEIVDIAKELRLDGLQFQQVMFLDEETLKRYDDEVKDMGCESRLDDERLNHGQEKLEVSLLIEKMKDVKKKSRALNLRVSFLPHLNTQNLRRYYEDTSWTYGRRCLIPWMNVTIAPNGDVFPCIRIKLGNIRNHSIRSLWNGESFIALRQRLKEKGLFSRCRRCCHLGEF